MKCRSSFVRYFLFLLLCRGSLIARDSEVVFPVSIQNSEERDDNKMIKYRMVTLRSDLNGVLTCVRSWLLLGHHQGCTLCRWNVSL